MYQGNFPQFWLVVGYFKSVQKEFLLLEINANKELE